MLECAEVDANLTHWADGVIGPLADAGLARGLAQLALHDEPGWHFPANRNLTNATGEVDFINHL